MSGAATSTGLPQDIEELVRMANQIADFFAPYPHEEAVPAIADHVRQFWTPAMREKMTQHLAAAATNSGLHPLADEALRQLAAETTA